MNQTLIKAFAGAVLLALAGTAAGAQTPTLLGQERDWAAYTVDVNGVKTCYVLSQPKEQRPSGVENRRDPVYFFVTFRPKDDIKNQVSVIVGYPFKEESKASAEVGSDKFTMFTNKDKAWIEDLGEQQELVSAMKRGTRLTVRGTSQRGTNTIDTYSLLGITAAIGRAEKECG